MVVTAKDDLTADLVIRELTRRGGKVHRVDPDDVPHTLKIESSVGDGEFRLQDRYRTTHSREIRAVYWRKPKAPERAEHVAALFGLLFTLDTPLWVNHPWRNERASHKPHQLMRASRCGFNVPATLMTSEKETAREFIEGAAFRTITKTLRQQEGAFLPARFVAPEGLGSGLLLLQQYIEKDFDVRLTAVGEQLFAAKIVAPPGIPDWRQPPPRELAFEELRRIPAEIEVGVLSYMKLYGLEYGAFDFAVDHQGDWWFLECNPNGQYGFVEYATGMEISRALAEHLSRAGTA